MPVFVSTVRPCEIGKEAEAQKIKILLKESTHTSRLTQRLSPHLVKTPEEAFLCSEVKAWRRTHEPLVSVGDGHAFSGRGRCSALCEAPNGAEQN